MIRYDKSVMSGVTVVWVAVAMAVFLATATASRETCDAFCCSFISNISRGQYQTPSDKDSNKANRLSRERSRFSDLLTIVL